MTLFASLFLNAVVAAGPATPLPWYSFQDYPMKAFEREWQGATTISVLVNPDGRPAGCTVDKSSGYDTLDRQTCWVAMKRARFTPASGPDGRAVYGLYRSQVVWSRPDRDFVQRDPGPDLEVQVQTLPSGTSEPPAVKIAYFVDANGNPSSCTPFAESAKQPQSLIDAACRELLGKLPHTPVAASAGAVPAVKTAAIVFTTGK
jgi:TonB family protein